MGEPEAARMAWLNLVCGNKFSYDPNNPSGVTAEAPNPAEEAKDAEQKKHPALGLDATAPAAQDGPYVDIYEGCKLVQDDAQFVAETWLRIGEYHFDYDHTEHGLKHAISAYRKLLAMPEDRNYNLALYKLAWAFYRASDYPEAIKHFGMLVDWSDESKKRTGKEGSELRAEAVQYMGIAFAYDDWNENQVVDTQEGLPTGLDRIQQEKLLPQGKQWTVEIYYQLGSIYFDEAKYPEAIRTWQLALSKWPMDHRAPEIQNQIATAYSRSNEMEKAIAAKGKLSEYGEGSPWWNANLENPAAQRRAEELAEDSLISTAVYHHQKAQQTRRQGVEEKNIALLQQAQEQYRLAAQAYREYLNRYPNNPQAYELRYNLADALFWAEDYEGAATEYASVRDSNLDDTYLSESARRVVEALKRMVEIAEEKKELVIRTEPPEPQGAPPRVTPMEMPQLLQRLAQARELYLARVDEGHDSEGVRHSYDYNNALLLYRYGYWPQAKERFERIFEQRCSGSTADETGRIAWLDLRNMAVIEQDTDEVERLGQALQDKKCSFGSDKGKAIDCKLPENQEEPQCLAGADLTNIKYKRAVEVFEQAEKATDEAKKQELYEQAASMLIRAVNEEPNHPQAPFALEKAAIALERTNRFESAARLYQRIIDEVGPRKTADLEEQKRMDAILSNAYFRLAFNANRFFDYERAVENYRVLADSQRFAASKDPGMAKRREAALINAATILEYQQQYQRAQGYYRRAAAALTDPEEKRSAEFRVAEMYYKEKNHRFAVKAMRDFIAHYRNEKGAGELVILAQWRIAQSQKANAQEKEYNKSLSAVVDIYNTLGVPPGSMGAEYAAEAKFILVDPGMAEFEKLKIDPGKPESMKAYAANIAKAIEKSSVTATERAKVYEPITVYRRPKWTIAAFVRQGRAYEVLAKAVLNTPFVMPGDLAAQLRKAPPEVREDIRVQVEDRVRQVLDEKVRPIECLAVARYALAARAAKSGSLDNEFTRIAIDRLQAYGDERIAECVSEAAKRDPSFAAYQAGEFTRAPRGKTRPLTGNVVAPPVQNE